jgi:hypothetical protein
MKNKLNIFKLSIIGVNDNNKAEGIAIEVANDKCVL